jgi:zeaxanthin glucosyltransferase
MEVHFPWDQLTGEPIVYASMGTVQNGNADIFRIIAASFSKHKGLQLVLSIGDVLNPQEIGRVPNNAIVVNNAPQLELLKKASVCITHAGFNTDKKTGKTTSLDGLDASNLSGLLDEVLNNPIYRDNSRSLQKAIAKKNGISVAADLIEQNFGLTKKTEAPVQKTA